MSKLGYLERRQLAKKVAYLLLALLFLSFIAGTLFGDKGFLYNMRVQTDHDTLLAEKQRLTAENKRLAQEIQALKNSDRKIEALGRREFGFGRPGEIIFCFPDQEQSAVEEYHR